MDSIDTEVKATTMNEMDEVVAQMDNGQSKLKRGQLVTAIISSASDEGVAVLLPFFKKKYSSKNPKSNAKNTKRKTSRRKSATRSN